MYQNSLIGKRIGNRYRIDEILGQGGMSAVYKAFDPNLKRVVAVKVIHFHLANDPKFIVRFEEEAAAVAQLRHPNIVQVFDFNHDQDLYYMVQEFVAGETLQELLRRLNKSGKRMPMAEAIRYTLDICDAAGYAHQRGMIHRDIKPANIMLDVHGKAILMDFGIVKITGGEKHTATGAVVGTALYMPPELIRGEVIDPRADIYSLGVTLFEMVSGRPPYEADSAMTVMMMHLRDPLPDMQGLRPDVSQDLIDIIERALAKDPKERYASMVEFASDLKATLNDLPATIIPKATLVDQPLELETAVDQGADIPLPTVDVQQPVSPATLIEPPTIDLPVQAETASDHAIADLEDKTFPVDAIEAGATIIPDEISEESEGTLKINDPTGLAVAGLIDSTSPPIVSKKIRPVVWIGVAVLFLLVVLGGIGITQAAKRSAGEKNTGLLEGEATPASSMEVAAFLVEPDFPTETVTPTPSPTLTPTPTQTFTPTQTPTITLSPTPTIPPGVPFVRIHGITLDANGKYIVNYETLEYVEKLPGTHIHFFFDTIPPEQAGFPLGSGQWILYGGPRPFTGYGQNNRPANATQMCALVANPDHSVQPDSGYCFDLPDVVLITNFQDAACLVGPDPAFPIVTTIFAGQRLLVRGISQDESWWYVANPLNMDESCWIPQTGTLSSGDLSTLVLIEAPPLPEGATATDFSVEIQQITLDNQGRYVVDYTTQGFTESLPGIHLHFFFDTVPPDQVGMSGSGSRLMYGGPAPFTGYTSSDRPPQATQLCVLVANPDHSIILESGNCFQLPGVQNP